MRLTKAQKAAFLGLIENAEIEELESWMDEQEAAAQQAEFIRGLQSPENKRRLVDV